MSPTTAKNSIPDEFICPITQNLMTEPLMTKEGHSFEREAILEWIQAHGTCPLTRRPLFTCHLIRNRTLEVKIAKWCRTQSIWDLDEQDKAAVTAYYSSSDSAQRLFQIKMALSAAKQ